MINSKPSIGITMHTNQNLELLLAGGLALGLHELRELVRGAELVVAVQAVGEGIVGSEIVMVASLAAGLVEEFGSEGVICLNFENLGDQIGGYPAELAEFGGDVGAPLVVVSAEGIDDEARDRGEA